MAATTVEKTEPETARHAAESAVWQELSKTWIAHRPAIMAICRELDLFPPQIMVLQTLDRPKPMREVAAHLSCNSSNLTGITDRLEDRDLVKRTADPSDRRVKLLVLTPEGEKLRAEVTERMHSPPETFAALSDEDLQTLREILGRLNSAASAA